MGNEVYYHVEKRTLKVIEALMKGFIVTLGGDRIRYLRKGQIIDDREVIESGFFVPMESSNGDLWVKLTGELGFIESKIASASIEEIEHIIASFAHDSLKREQTVGRILSVALSRLKRDGGRSFLLKAFDLEDFERTESIIINRLYSYLQKDNTFAMDRVSFYSFEHPDLDGLLSLLFDTLNALILEGLIETQSVDFDACPYAKAVKLQPNFK